ncbi:MAG: hypothetical protein MUF38_09915 [Anaerolineae bacterium]|jgi:hypothetical protein|nr:hypothetical protein [Anaerolineae bacterium]
MSKPPQPALAEIVYHYLGLFQRSTRQIEFERAEKQFVQAVQRVQSADEIRAALALDMRSRRLPVQMKSPAYERLLSLCGRTAELLREYAQEMYEFGPAFQHYADQLWAEAKQLDGKGD